METVCHLGTGVSGRLDKAFIPSVASENEEHQNITRSPIYILWIQKLRQGRHGEEKEEAEEALKLQKPASISQSVVL